MYLTPLFVLMFLVLAAYGQVQERVAILNTEDDGEPHLDFTDLNYLNARLRELAVKILPEEKYFVMTAQSIIDMMGSVENARKVCKEAQCIAEIGRKISADYIGQARLGRFGGNLTISMELYHSARGNLIGSFTGNAKDVFGLLAIVNENAPQMFGKMPGALAGSKAPSSSVAGGISGVQSTGGGYEFEGGKSYLANIVTEPEGAVVSFNGVPDSRCAKTPCKLVLGEGNVRIVAALDQYERADTTVFIKQNNQSISIRLKANFGVLEIKPAFLEGIGRNEQWSLSINGKAAYSWENRLSPGKYKVELSHRCYEVLSFDAGINKDEREVFNMADMASHISLKKGGLVLNAEKDGEPISEPVFVNGKQSGETPFSNSVPVCAEIELGKNRERVDVKLKPNEKVEHTVKSNSNKSSVSTTPEVSVAPIISSFKDSRDNKTYKMVKIGNQTWMAENLNYNASGSKCYVNKESNCQKYGRLYNWETAKTACPKGWHLPTKDEYGKLDNFVGGVNTAGKFLKATSGWNNNGNGNDKFGFSALPGGYGNSDGSFNDVGYDGYWWCASDGSSNRAYCRYMTYGYEIVRWNNDLKSYLYSVRCLQD
ncbi:MAG: PEGA domain-containing protein [Fibromonadaceae bacterium]|jgi:uncharacterized protein (TIGR02145 family)|nr:PEGA domain-containing protein [Fibromonadaceae bacterium]